MPENNDPIALLFEKVYPMIVLLIGILFTLYGIFQPDIYALITGLIALFVFGKYLKVQRYKNDL